jgi:hypothetical protein
MRSAGRHRLPFRRDSICSSRTRITKETKTKPATASRHPSRSSGGRTGARRKSRDQTKPNRPAWSHTPSNRPAARNKNSRTNPFWTSILKKPSHFPLPKRTQKRTHRSRPATLPVERRLHRCPAQPQGPNEAKPASHAPLHPTEHPGNARNDKRTQKVPCFQHQPRENEPILPRTAPALYGARPSGGAGPPCGSTRRPTNPAPAHPPEPACRAAAPGGIRPPNSAKLVCLYSVGLDQVRGCAGRPVPPRPRMSL